jgi:hypothetical protein
MLVSIMSAMWNQQVLGARPGELPENWRVSDGSYGLNSLNSYRSAVSAAERDHQPQQSTAEH